MIGSNQRMNVSTMVMKVTWILKFFCVDFFVLNSVLVSFRILKYQ